MKKIILMLMLGLVWGCKRAEIPPEDILANSYWHGLYSLTGDAGKKVFCIQFTEGNNMVWKDWGGTYTGTWSKNGDEVTITFHVNGAQTAFTLAAGKVLTNAKNINHAVWTISELTKIESSTREIGTRLPRSVWMGQPFDYNLAFDNPEEGKVAWRGGSAATLFGTPSYTVAGPVVSAGEVDLGLSRKGRFFGVFANDKLLRANFWFYNAGNPAATLQMYYGDHFSPRP